MNASLQPLASQLRAPLSDITRTRAARLVGELAARRGLFLFDYEARLQLELPEHWLPVGRPDLEVSGQAPGWHRGLLGESKYLSFRHDQLLGSLHAGQRAKWGAHELCHGLVGFAWNPEGSLLYHALAARLAEALPVALWYFFDEAGLVRCPRHEHTSELGAGYCRACELIAREKDEIRYDDTDRDWVLRGRQFLARELATVRESIRLKRPVFAPHGGIDLMSDGLNYAAAHLQRLRSPEHQSFMVHFFPETGVESGRFEDLEAFADHIERLGQALADACLGFERPAALDNLAPVALPGRFIAQDIGQRLVQVAADADGECHAELMRLVADLGQASRQADAALLEEGIQRAIEGYEALFEDFELPDPAEVLAVGYELPNEHGIAWGQLLEGLESAAGSSVGRLSELYDEDQAIALIEAARNHSGPSRKPLVRRVVDVLKAEAPYDLETRGLFALEAAISDSTPPDPMELALGFDGYGAEVVDTLSLAAGVEVVRPGYDAGGLLTNGEANPEGPSAFLVRRDAGDQVGLVAISDALAERLELGELGAIEVLDAVETNAELRALVEEGLLVPAHWDLLI